MDTRYLNTARHGYMILSGADYGFEEYELYMVLKNQIACLLPMEVILSDGRAEYWYEVTGMQSLDEQMNTERMDYGSLCVLLGALCAMKGQMEGYLLNDECLELSAQRIYYDKNTQSMRFCYIPGYSNIEGGGIKHLLEDVMENLDHGDARAVKTAYEVYENTSSSGFLVTDTLSTINRYRDYEEEESAETLEESKGLTALTAKSAVPGTRTGIPLYPADTKGGKRGPLSALRDRWPGKALGVS